VSDAAAPNPFGVGLPLDTEVSRPRPGTVLLEVDGEIDTATAPRLQAGLDEALDTADAEGSRVVVDLTGVTFLASSGLAVLIGGARRVTALGGRLRLVAASRSVTRPLQVTGADALFDTFDDVASALSAEAKGAGASQRAPASEERTAPVSRPFNAEAKGAGASQRAPASEERTAPESRPFNAEAKASAPPPGVAPPTRGVGR
jgi:anti-sigma B factor antagonist